MNLGDKVRRRRIYLGISQEELAKRMGYKSRSSVNKIENGRPVSQKIIFRLAEVLETTPEYLFGWEEQNDNDLIADIIIRLRNDKEFFSIVATVYKESADFSKLVAAAYALDSDKQKQLYDYILFLSNR